MNSLRRKIRNAVVKLSRLSGIERQLVLSGQLLSAQNLTRGKVKVLSDLEFRVFSQFGEDGIIDWLVSSLPIQTKTFIEFGVEDYRESNTRFLLASRNWTGFVMDGDEQNIAAVFSDDISYKHDIRAAASFITAENINESVMQSGIGRRVGLLSVDMDGVDWWVLKAMDVEADIVIVEYNDFLGPDPVTVPYSPDFQRGKAHWSHGYWGRLWRRSSICLSPRDTPSLAATRPAATPSSCEMNICQR